MFFEVYHNGNELAVYGKVDASFFITEYKVSEQDFVG